MRNWWITLKFLTQIKYISHIPSNLIQNSNIVILAVCNSFSHAFYTILECPSWNPFGRMFSWSRATSTKQKLLQGIILWSLTWICLIQNAGYFLQFGVQTKSSLAFWMVNIWRCTNLVVFLLITFLQEQSECHQAKSAGKLFVFLYDNKLTYLQRYIIFLKKKCQLWWNSYYRELWQL